MNKAIVLFGALGVLAGWCGHARSADQPGPPAVEQPKTIPGNWKLTAQPLPPLREVASRPADHPVYGLYTWCGEYKAHRDSIRKVGWRSVRVGGPMDDESFALMQADGVEVMKTLGLRDIAGAGGNKKNRADYADDETFLADYVKGIQTFLKRYGPGGTFFKDKGTKDPRPIKHVEIWNEPNFQYMIPDSNDRKADFAAREALYAKVLPAAYAAIKKDWPEVTVVGFGAGGSASADVAFVKNVLAKDPAVAKSFDVLSTHPYVAPVPPETDSVRSWGSYSAAKSLEAIRKNLAERQAADKPIWYTEVGWPISKADGGFFETKGPDFATPTLQAAYVVRMYALAMRLRVQRVHIMFATDTDNFNAGFFLRDGAWRPSAHAVATMIKLLPHPVITEAISDGAEGYYAYRMTPHAFLRAIQRPVVMAWNVEGPKTVQMAWEYETAKAVDMFGHQKELPVREGKVSVEVGPCPVYLVSALDPSVLAPK